MRRRSAARAALFLAVLAALPLAAWPAAAESEQACSSCHSISGPAAGYVLRMPSVYAICPAVVPPGAGFNYTLKVVHPGSYSLQDPEPGISLEGPGSLAPDGSAALKMRQMGESGGTASVTWRLETGAAAGTLHINATFRFSARHRHTVTEDTDDSEFVLRRFSSVEVRPAELYVSVSDIPLPALGKREADIELVSTSSLRNVTLAPAPGLEGVLAPSPSSFASLSPGERRVVRVRLSASPVLLDNGRLQISWENATGVRNATFVMVRALAGPADPGQQGPVRWMGRATGLLSMGLLVASVVIGYIKGGGRRRIRLHCAVSWFILGLSVYHGISLALFPYNRVWLGNWVVLGYVTAAVMGLSSLNGLLQRSWTKKLGYRNWLWLHRISLIAAIGLSVVHALMIGTDFRFLHAVGGGGRGGD
jgi:hypothetical protein